MSPPEDGAAASGSSPSDGDSTAQGTDRLNGSPPVFSGAEDFEVAREITGEPAEPEEVSAAIADLTRRFAQTYPADAVHPSMDTYEAWERQRAAAASMVQTFAHAAPAMDPDRLEIALDAALGVLRRSSEATFDLMLRHTYGGGILDGGAIN